MKSFRLTEDEMSLLVASRLMLLPIDIRCVFAVTLLKGQGLRAWSCL